MSDLHQAVQAEIAAHTPALPPSFDALKARKRQRDRRRATAAAAVSALAVAGVAFVPSALLSGDGQRGPAQVAQDPGDAELFGFHIKATDTQTVIDDGEAGLARIQLCLELPGVSGTGALFSHPGQYTGRVTGGENADGLRNCVASVPGWGATLTPVDPAGEARTYTVQPSDKLVLNPRLEQERDACFALPGVAVVSVEESLPATYRVAVPVSGAAAFERCIQDVVGLAVPELTDEVRRGCSSFTEAVHQQDSNEVYDQRTGVLQVYVGAERYPLSRAVQECRDNPVAMERLKLSLPPSTEYAVKHLVYTHCGVLSTTIDGVLWVAEPPLPGPPRGWDENETTGDFRLTDSTHAVFTADTGVEATFTRAQPGASDPAAGCD